MSDVDGPGPEDLPRRGEPGEGPDLDVDSAFAAIVADFSTSVPGGPGLWPAAENLPDENLPDDGRGPGPARTPEEEYGGHATPGEGHSPPPDTRRGPGPLPADDEDFIPPLPPPIPRGDVVSRLAWGSVLGGPAFLLLAAMFWRSLPSSLLLLALVAFVGGFITLVARMPAEPPDDGDDGAVV
jgi:hypothetical protein